MNNQITTILPEEAGGDDDENMTHSDLVPRRDHLPPRQKTAADEETNGYMGGSSDGNEEPDNDATECSRGIQSEEEGDLGISTQFLMDEMRTSGRIRVVSN